VFSLSHVVVLPVMCLPVWYQCGYLEVAHSLDTSFNGPSYDKLYKCEEIMNFAFLMSIEAVSYRSVDFSQNLYIPSFSAAHTLCLPVSAGFHCTSISSWSLLSCLFLLQSWNFRSAGPTNNLRSKSARWYCLPKLYLDQVSLHIPSVIEPVMLPL